MSLAASLGQLLMDVLVVVQMDSWIDRWMDGWMDEWIDELRGQSDKSRQSFQMTEQNRIKEEEEER